MFEMATREELATTTIPPVARMDFALLGESLREARLGSERCTVVDPLQPVFSLSKYTQVAQASGPQPIPNLVNNQRKLLTLSGNFDTVAHSGIASL